MNETLLWLLYCVGGILAFAGVYRRRWRIIWAVVSGGLITLIGWLLIYRFTEEEKRPDWIQLDLSLNLTFALIFATIGASIGWWRSTRRRTATTEGAFVVVASPADELQFPPQFRHLTSFEKGRRHAVDDPAGNCGDAHGGSSAEDQSGRT